MSMFNNNWRKIWIGFVCGRDNNNNNNVKIERRVEHKTIRHPGIHSYSIMYSMQCVLHILDMSGLQLWIRVWVWVWVWVWVRVYLNKSPMFTECSAHMQFVSLRYCVLVMSKIQQKMLLNICILEGETKRNETKCGCNVLCASMLLLPLQSIKCQKCIADNKTRATVRANDRDRATGDRDRDSQRQFQKQKQTQNKKKKKKRHWLNDVLTAGPSRLVVWFLGMTDIWLVLTWTQFLTFILLGISTTLSAQCKRQVKQPTSQTSCVNMSICQSVNRVNWLAMFA